MTDQLSLHFINITVNIIINQCILNNMGLLMRRMKFLRGVVIAFYLIEVQS